jgi:hypothetical protein
MKSTLVIVDTYIENRDFLTIIAKPYDVLALTPISMHSLDKLDVSFKTVTDYYSKQQFINYSQTMFGETENIFKRLDELYDNYTMFPYVYSGNICFFLQLLCELLYIERLCEEITHRYYKIVFINYKHSKFESWEGVTIKDLKTSNFSQSLSFQKQISGMKRKMIIMQTCVDSENIIHISLKRSNNLNFCKQFKIFQNSISYFKMSVRRFLKNINYLLLPVNSFIQGGKKTLFKAQGGYAVNKVSDDYSEVVFVDIISKLRDDIEKQLPVEVSFKDGLEIIGPYLEKYWPKLRSHVESLFVSYNREIVGRIPLFIENVTQIIDNYRPCAFLYSIGTRDVLDCVTGYIANQQNIPVIYFQHGGTQIFHNSIFQKYVENDAKIIKTLILDSKIEKTHLVDYGSNSITLGSPMIYDYIHNNKLILKRDLLYLSSSFPSTTYRSLLNGELDIDFYNTSKDILEVSNYYKLGHDVKVHPVEIGEQHKYFTKLKFDNNYSYCRIIKSPKAEKLIHQYGVIVLNAVGSAIFSYVISLKIPIILYLKDETVLNSISSDDINQRCYVVTNKDELKNIVGLYVRSELPSKWSKQMIDRYIYPVSEGSPVENIQNCIKSLI